MLNIETKRELKLFAAYFFYWILLSFLDRFFFIFSFFEKIGPRPFEVILNAYWHGLKLDVSTACYLSVLPFLLFYLQKLVPGLVFTRIWRTLYTASITLIFGLTSIININIYREWGDKISKRAIDAFLISPSGAVASAESTPVLVPLLILLSFFIVATLYYRFVTSRIRVHSPYSSKADLLLFVMLSIVLFTGIRGGYGRAALNPSVAYYSENTFQNHAAVNTQWALLRDYFKSKNSKNPYQFFDKTKADTLLKEAFDAQADSAISILNTDRPNVVLIILESFVGDLIASMGGEKGITPNFEKLIQEGVFFDRIYAASDRSDKGMVGICSAFPAQGPESIIKSIEKHEELPAFGQQLDSLGYEGSFYHGGASEFYNFKSYMLTHGVGKIVDIAAFPLDQRKASWGVYDHLVFERMLQDFDAEKKPFFSTMFTIINHEPFELIGKYQFGNNSNANKFRSTAFYTDSVLYDFIEKAQKKSWYDNTLFIVVADHGHRLPAEKWDLYHPNRFHIPLLFFGNVIKPEYRGKTFHNIGNQTDLVKTLFTQMNIDSSPYPWSRDLLNPSTPAMAFYNSKDMFGIITPFQTISFDNVGKIINYRANTNMGKEENEHLLDIAKAYYQEVFRQYLTY